MENKINIAEILKDCPKGMKLYSLIYGEVEFSLIDDTNDNYPICIKTNLGSFVNFTKDGRYAIRFPTAECLLFPSSEMRDWTKFFKRGDVAIHLSNGCGVLVEEWTDDSYTSFKASVFQLKKGGFAKRDKRVLSIDDFVKASDEQRDKFISDMEKFFGGKYNPDIVPTIYKSVNTPRDKNGLVSGKPKTYYRTRYSEWVTEKTFVKQYQKIRENNMINEEKIKAATDVVFADVLSPKANICMSAGFIRGIEWF